MDKIQELLVAERKCNRIQMLFELLLEQMDLSPQSSRKEFFDKLTEFHTLQMEVTNEIGKMVAAQSRVDKPKRVKKTGEEASLSVSN